MSEPGEPLSPHDPYAPPGAPTAQAPAWPDPAAPDYGRFDPLPTSAPTKGRGLAIALVLGAVAIIVGVVVVLATRTDAIDEHATIQTTAAPAAGGGTTIHTHGITIVLPPGWSNLPTTPAELKALAQKIATSNPQMAQAAKAMSDNAALSHFAMFAVHPGASGSASTQEVNVVVAPSQGESLDSIALEVKAGLIANGAGDLQLEDTQVNGRDGFKITYTLSLKGQSGQTVTAPVVAYFAAYDGMVAAITVSPPRDGKDAQAIADSLVFS